jgi:hypothetical protein
VLYQILGSFDQAMHIHLKKYNENPDNDEYQLILEPKGGGGDTVVTSSKGKIVQQWKAKSDHGSWSLAKIIDEVIPDLYLAVDTKNLNNDSRYWFMTEGRKGNWKKAEDFFKKLDKTTPENPIDLFDDTSIIASFSRNQVKISFTEKTLFQEIVKQVRKRKDVRHEDETLTYRKLWHLLSRFELKGSEFQEKIQKHINDFLFGVVDYREDIDAKRQQLCGMLMEKVSTGEVTLSPTEFLQEAHIDAISLQNWVTIQKRLHQLLDHNLTEIAKYSPSEDVRKVPNWPKKTPILLLSGESGQGKTWQLAKLALSIAQQGEQGIPTVFVEATGDADKTLQNAADIFWKDAADHDNSLTIDRIVRRRDKISNHKAINQTLQNRNPWLLICVDDIQDTKEANDLLKKDWQDWGIRLAATVPPTINKNLYKKELNKVFLVEVADFDTDELNEYLAYRNQNWQKIPPDVRTTLHRPLLAKLYCDLVTESESWKPINEYQLYEKYWARISEAREQVDHPNDLGALRQLVGTIFDGHYPWTPEQMKKEGDDDVRKRLEAIGWLRRIHNNNAEIWHDRLLNWAVAENVAANLEAQRQNSTLSCEQLGKKLAELLFGKKKIYAGKRLDYVPMDVLWIISHQKHFLSTEVHKYIGIISSSARSFHINPDAFYYYLLPTLGERIIPAIIKHAQASEDWYEANRLKITFTEIGKTEPNVVSKAALNFLNKTNLFSDLQQFTIQILSKYPDAKALDKLWEIHKQNVKMREDKTKNRQGSFKNRQGSLWFYQNTSAALSACVPLNPEWLIKKIYTIKSDEPIWELAYKLNTLDASATDDIWKKVREKLFDKVPSHKLRCLVVCVGHFKDMQKLGWLEDCLKLTQVQEDQDWIIVTAFVVLVKLEPKRALTYLKKISEFDLALSKKQWLPELLIRMPTETHQYIRERMTTYPKEFWKIANIYTGNENEIDTQTFELLLNALEQILSDMIDKLDFNEDSIPRLHMVFPLFSKVSRYELLNLLKTRANSELEKNLIKFAVLRIDSKKNPRLSRDSTLEEIKSILLKIGGSGMTEVINAELEHSDFMTIRRYGIIESLFSPNNLTRQKLRKIVQNGIANSHKIKQQNEEIYEQQLAVTKLASLGDIETVVDAILHWGGDIATFDLPNILNEQVSVSDELLDKITYYLDSDNSEKCANAVLVIENIRKKSFIPQIRKFFEKAEPDSTLAFNCLLAMHGLEDKDKTTVKCLKRHLLSKNDERRKLAGNALLKIGTTETIEVLKEYLSTEGNLENRVNINLIVALINKYQSEAELFAPIIWEQLKQSKRLIHLNPNCLEIVGYLDDPEIVHWLWDYISPFEDSGINQERQYALYGLKKSNSEMAFDAACLLLENAEKNKTFLPKLLIELDEKRAIPFLCQHLPQEKETLCKWAIGRTLRNAESKDLVYGHIGELLDSPNSTERQAGSELCGWQELPSSLQDKLFQCATNDVDNKVRRVAIKSLQNQQQRKETLKLMNALKTAQGIQRWSMLEAILQQEDPYLLSNKKDLLLLDRLLENMPYYFTLHAQERLKQRVKEIEKAAKKIDK